MNLDRYFKQIEGFNIRERANIYVGAALGLLAPVAACKYYFVDIGCTNTNETELMKWGISFGSMLGLSFLARGLPLAASTLMGAYVGYRSARDLQINRWDRKNKSKRELE